MLIAIAEVSRVMLQMLVVALLFSDPLDAATACESGRGERER